MCLCYLFSDVAYLFSAKTARQLVNQKADFFLPNKSIRIDSHKESNPIDSNRELECSSPRKRRADSKCGESAMDGIRAVRSTEQFYKH